MHAARLPKALIEGDSTRTSQGAEGALDQHVGRRIRGKQRALDLSVADLAKAIGVTPDIIVAYQSGAVTVPPDQLARLGEFLGVPVSYFLPASSAGTS